jgi:hypothetical protein
MSEEIHELRAAIATAEQAQTRYRKQLELVTRLEARVRLYRDQLASEKRDVEQLEGPGLAAFLRGLFVDRDVELDRERRELATAVLLHDEARAELAEAQERLPEVSASARELPEIRARLEHRLRELAAGPGGLAPDDARELQRIELGKLRRELDEAIQAAEAATRALEELLAALGTARTLGAVDLFGGGALVSMMKHGQIGTVRSRLATAQLKLRMLAREVEDLRETEITSLELSGLTEFVDVFFDNIFTDWSVQSRLELSSTQTREVKARVQRLQLDLRQRLRTMEEESNRLSAGPD